MGFDWRQIQIHLAEFARYFQGATRVLTCQTGKSHAGRGTGNPLFSFSAGGGYAGAAESPSSWWYLPVHSPVFPVCARQTFASPFR